MTAAFWKLLGTSWGRPLDLLFRAALAGTAAARRLWPAESVELTELCNKLEAFTGFRRGCRPSQRRSAGEKAARSAEGRASRGRRDDPYRALWVREGTGYAFAEERIRAEGALGLRAVEIDGAADLPLCTGLGLCLAIRLVSDRSARPVEVSDRFVGIVGRTIPPGYRPFALENLGFAVRLLRPRSLSTYDRVLAERAERAKRAERAERDPELSELFRHGAGRGLYFAPSRLVSRRGPGWPALEQVLSEVRDEPGRRNGVAGLAWALTLVNVRHPEVVERRLRGLIRRPEATPWAAHGVASALMFWRVTTGDREVLGRFLDHSVSPGPGSGEAGAELWAREVIGPARAAISGLLPRLERDQRLSELFRCRSPLAVPPEVDAAAGAVSGSR